jgi:hypothetical protein
MVVEPDITRMAHLLKAQIGEMNDPPWLQAG